MTAEAEGLKIKFSATGHDRDALGQEGSGIHHFNYTISSTQDTLLEGIPEDKRTGIFTQEQIVEIMTTPTGNREETTYSIKVTATDNTDNVSANKTTNVNVIYGITIAQAKELVNENTLKDYIGIRIIDYNPKAGGIWRVFYYDADNYFGYGNKTLYFKRDVNKTEKKIAIQNMYENYSSSQEGIEIMKRMNPMYRDDEDQRVSKEIESKNSCFWLCDPQNWEDYATSSACVCIGGPSIEMFVRSYNTWLGRDYLSYSIGKKADGNNFASGYLLRPGYTAQGGQYVVEIERRTWQYIC